MKEKNGGIGKISRVVAGSAATLALGYVGASYVCYRLAFAKQKHVDCYLEETSPAHVHIEPYLTEIKKCFQWVEEKEKETCYITARDGATLVGDFIEKPGSKRVLLLMHGYRSSYYNDFACAVPWMYEQGFHIMMPDQRAQGRSGGSCLTFGVLEKHDCLCWINYLIEKLGEDCEIILHGISMGAATVLMAAGLELPPQVKGISADSTFTTPTEIIKRTARRYLKIDASYFMPMLRTMCRVLGHFDLDDGDTRTAIQDCQLPLLLLHGEGDKFVPCYMSEETYQAATTPHKQFVHVPDAGHGLSYLVDQNSCRKAILKFWEQCLEKSLQSPANLI